MAGKPTRTMWLLALGAVCGVLATVLFFTIDPRFEADETNGAGVGNAVLVLDEHMLAAIIGRELGELPAFGAGTYVEVRVRTSGLVDVAIFPGGPGSGRKAAISIDPNIQAGGLQTDIVDDGLDGLAPGAEVAALIRGPIQARLDGLAGGMEYRLVSIKTTDRRLTLEVTI